MKNQFYQVISIIAILSFFVPIVIVLLKKLWHVKPFLLFALFWLLGGLVNMVDFIPLERATVVTFTIIYNVLDMPLILGIFYFTTTLPGVKKFTRVAIPVFIVLELTSLFIKGISYDAIKYTMGIGLLLVLTVIMWEIIIYLRKISHTGHEKGMLLINAALLFEYGTFVVIYIFDYYLEGASATIDNFIVYYISSIIAIVVASCGYLTRGVGRVNTKYEKGKNQISKSKVQIN